jgi:glyoxylase-like metal-dependent hydrolase (beta-lactamase superfamily II)
MFGDGQVLDVPGRPRVVHAPGHSPGCAALLLEDRRVLFAGDVLCTRNPLTGRTGPQIIPAAFNSDTRQAMSSLDNLGGIEADVMLAGHCEPWTGSVPEAVRLARAAGPS